MKYYLFIVLMVGMTTIGCNNEKISKQDDQNAAVPTTTTQNSLFPSKLSNGIPVYHAAVGITDTIGGPRIKFIRDTLIYALQAKYLYIDTKNELHLTDSPESLSLSQINVNTPYVMQMHLYDNAAPTGNNFQVINVGFTYSEATNISRAGLADRPNWYDWDKVIKTNDFPACTTADVSCKAKTLLRNIITLAYK